MSDPLRITLLQTDIVWEDKQTNLRRFHERLCALRGMTEIIVLPETFSTGFSMNVSVLAEPTNGTTITTLKNWAKEFDIAIAGSYIAQDKGEYYNRGFFLMPDGQACFYDKRHLFRMGGEAEVFTSGNKRPIIHYRGWNILLQICYDLRFPVWSRNHNQEYDLALYVANWPASRRHVWDILLQARALENQCYVCGVNRIGSDGNGLFHNGGSILLSPKGETLASLSDDTEGVATATLDHASLTHFRQRFPVWQDAD